MAGSRRRWIAVAGAVCTVLVGPQPALAGDTGSPPSATALSAVTLTWTPCPTAEAGTAAGVECSTAGLPMDYDQPAGAEVHIAVARVPATDRAHRIGSLFFNFGGPGGTSVDYLQANGAGIFADLNKRFDIVGFDPRGVGQSTPSIDCRVNQEQLGIYSQPVPTPQTLDRAAYIAKVKAYVNACVQKNGEILRHVSTANVARDMDALRAAVGDRKLNYLGFSYGTFLGATYAALFPHNYRALVLDGPVDAEAYINDPITDIAVQTASFEDALDRFLAACKADQTACQHFGGSDPSKAFDALIARAEQHPIDASGYAPDPRPVDGDDIRMATASFLYAKQNWPALAQALAEAAGGDASFLRAVVDEAFYARDPDTGTFDPISDRYFTIGASEQRYPRDPQIYFDRGARSFHDYPHFWWNSGYAELSYALLAGPRRGCLRRSLHHPGLVRHAAGHRHDARPGHPVHGRQASGPRAGELAAPDDGGRRPHGVRAATRPASTGSPMPTSCRSRSPSRAPSASSRCRSPRRRRPRGGRGGGRGRRRGQGTAADGRAPARLPLKNPPTLGPHRMTSGRPEAVAGRRGA